MKVKIKLFFLVIFTISCNKEFVEKPDDLISEDEMVDILFDIAIVKANASIKSAGKNEKDTMNLNNDYVFKKYAIDSTRLAKSNVYYASKPDEHVRIFTRVMERLDAEKEILDAKKDSLKLKSEKTKPVKKPETKKKPLDSKKDSI